ncbi:MAG TPA: MlaE family lipid ABC transporter permease subunit [Geminicoccaceae bacterium]|nr:MlaE family lipid ABC transporter permease subunit [Geminicoccaceae bacterium]
MADGWLATEREGGALVIEAGGGWTLPSLADLDRELRALVADAPAGGGSARIVLDRLEALDTGGAWLLHRTGRDLGGRGLSVELTGASAPFAALLDQVSRVQAAAPPAERGPNPLVKLVAAVGAGAIGAAEEGKRLLAFFGLTVITLGRVLVRPRRLRVTSLVSHLEQTGLNAVPIVGLISFLIGVVLAYQGAFQLRRFGAELFTINLLGVSILREIGILLTAIMVAGRSGSAFTAQIGTMQVNEEVDALRTLGLDPVEVLVLPRVLALILALPLLAFFANIMGLVGGGLMCLVVLDVPPAQFVAQLGEAVVPADFWTGLVKAPVFAFLIALVGCYEGLRVSGSAESVGRLTTQSVVVGIFLVLVVDALFSVLFASLGI